MNEWMIYIFSSFKTQNSTASTSSSIRTNTIEQKDDDDDDYCSAVLFWFFFLNIFTFALFLNKTRTRDTRSSKSFVEYYNTSLPITTTYQSHITSSSHQEDDDDDDDYDDDNDDDEMMIWRMCIQKLEWSRRDVSDQWTRSSTTNLFEREWKSNTHTYTHTYTKQHNDMLLLLLLCCCDIQNFNLFWGFLSSFSFSSFCGEVSYHSRRAATA